MTHTTVMTHNTAGKKNMDVRTLMAGGFICAGLLLCETALLRADQPAVADLIAQLKSPDAKAQIQAIDQLAAQGGQAAAALSPLTELLKSKTPAVRAHAVRALGALGAAGKPAVPAIAELLKDPDDSVRRQIVPAIQAIHPGPEVTVPLCVKLLKDADTGIRVRILSALADAGAGAVPGLIEALKMGDDAAYWACIVARSIGPEAKEIVPALTERLKDKNPALRREVILTLGAMGDAAVPAVPEIAKALDDGSTRTAATFVLGQLGKVPADAEPKVLANAKDKDHLLSTLSIWTIARIHPDDKNLTKHAMEHLVSRLTDEDPFVREVAARGLLALPPAPELAVPIWEKAFKDMNEETAGNALTAVASLGAAAVPRLIEGLKHEQLRIPLAEALGRIGPAAAPAAPALAKLMTDKSAPVVMAAATALAAIGPDAKAAVPQLVAALDSSGDQPAEAAPAAAFALGRIGTASADAVPALQKLLQSKNESLALVSAWALTQIRPGDAQVTGAALPVLIAGLSAKPPLMRQSSAEALGSMGPAAKSALPALKKAAADSDKAVSEAAKQALAAVEKAR